MKIRKFIDRFITMNQKIISKSIEGFGSVFKDIIDGKHTKIIKRMETILSKSIKKTEKFITKRKVKKKQRKSHQKELQEIAKEHDALHDFEHIKYSIERKKQRLIELNTIHRLEKKQIRER
ncbi:hypothetical protein [Kordia jejudonensis]|uniref:hypothetical protein n=1 Tax=Kordia jejudonensis TaxID=1348245 RepID=UPI00062946CD|nr:hypothetical protein [Kordia jejudonensis]